jgi:glutathionyl-hydroquinone reductase
MESKTEAESKDVTEVVFNEADSDGHYRRKASQFRNWVSADPEAEFPAESGRYVLYLNLGCPW